MRSFALLIALVACSGSNKPVDPAPAPPPTVAVPDALVLDAAPALAADGAACLAASDCASGVCEGNGCGDDKPGTCAPQMRACTKDLREYCGCDGKTFGSSGSCPGQRYQDISACKGTAAAASKPDGAACLAASECASGVCEGEGCTDDKPGVCAPKQRGCTRDLRQYCGCDGKTFGASGKCPGQRYSTKAACTKAT